MSWTVPSGSVEVGLHKVDSKDEHSSEAVASSAKASYFNEGSKDGLDASDGNAILRLPSPGTFSEFSVDDTDAFRTGRPFLQVPGATNRHASKSPSPPRTIKGKLKAFWTRNKGLALVLVAQIFGTLMNVTTRLLEVEGNNGKGMHPFQILFARMGITAVLSTWYMWWRNIDNFLLGKKEVRWLLVARGLFGFAGVFGMYCESALINCVASIIAHVRLRLTPVLTPFRCHRHYFSRTQPSMLGVLVLD